LKTGTHTWTHSELEDARDSAALQVTEIEVGLQEWRKHEIDLAFAADIVNARDDTGFQDLRVTSRYHFRKDRRFSPVVGGGIGWYRWDTKERLELQGNPFNGPFIGNDGIPFCNVGEFDPPTLAWCWRTGPWPRVTTRTSWAG